MTRRPELKLTTPQDPFIGPPKPWSCAAGWTSHVWTCNVNEGRLSFTTDCRLCNDGIADLEPEYLEGTFPVTLHVHEETFGYYDPAVEVWWEIIPQSEPPISERQDVNP